jgi:2-methylcitrate dehydratase PrpD
VTALVEQVAEVAVSAREQGLSDARRHQAAQRVLDVFGNCLAASTRDLGHTVRALVDDWGGRETASVLGARRRYPAPSAALVNGSLAHGLDFDDTHLPSVLHPSSSVVPAALAAAERVSADGPALLDAVSVGNEVCVRLGMAGYDEDLGNSVFFEHGQHATAICGAVGAAVAAAMVSGVDTPGIASAAGIAASMGSGLLEANRTGGTVKRVHTGWAAHAATVAAEFAAHGLTGPPTVLEGRFGFFRAWCGERASPESVVDGLGQRWESDRIHLKPYPCNHFTHAGIDAALRMRDDGVTPDDLVSLELGVPGAVLRTIAEPPEVKAAPESGYAGAFSGPFTVAAALTGGGGLGVYLGDFTDEAVRDERRLEIARRVRCYADERCDALFPHRFPAVLRVRTRDGAEHEVRIEHNRGGPDRPLTDEEVGTKFRLGASHALPESQAAHLSDAILDLPRSSSLDSVLAGARPQ